MASLTSAIRLEPCKNLQQFQETLDQILTLDDPGRITAVAKQGLLTRSKTFTDKIRTFAHVEPTNTKFSKVRAEIIQFLNNNMQWLVRGNVDETFISLHSLPIFKEAPAELDKIHAMAIHTKKNSENPEEKKQEAVDALGVLRQKLKQREIALLSAIPSILNTPPSLFSHKLFDLILSARDNTSETDLKFFNTLCKNKNNPIALFLIGYCYYKFIGTLYFPDRAFYHFSLASRHGMPLATYYLGICHRDGIGTQQNIPEAVLLLSDAAKSGLSDAWISLGHMYENMKTRTYPEIPKDLKKAIECYEEAKKLGSSHAEKNLARLKSASSAKQN